RRAARVMAEAVDGLPTVGHPAEDLVEVPAVDPVRVQLDLRGLAAPVGDAQREGALPRQPRRNPEVRLVDHPLLDGPVRAVRRLTCGYDGGQGGGLVGAARVRK